MVGVGVFLGVLLYGPARPVDSRGQQLSTNAVRQQVVQEVRAHALRGDDREARRTLWSELEHDPDFAWGWMFLTQLAQRQPDPVRRARLLEACHAALIRLEEDRALNALMGSTNYRDWYVYAWAARAAGDEALARERFARGLELCDGISLEGTVAYHYDGACFLSLMGETEAALERISTLPELGYRNADWLRADPDLDALREDPRLEGMIRRVQANNQPRPAPPMPNGLPSEVEPPNATEPEGTEG